MLYYSQAVKSLRQNILKPARTEVSNHSINVIALRDHLGLESNIQKGKSANYHEREHAITQTLLEEETYKGQSGAKGSLRPES